MPKFEQLAGRTRKPVAVILSALMAMSATPVVPIAQSQAHVAYADDAQGGAREQKKGSYASEETVDWADLSANAPTVTFDAHPSDGKGTGTLHVSNETFLNYLKTKNSQVSDAVKARAASEEFLTGEIVKDLQGIKSSVIAPTIGDKVGVDDPNHFRKLDEQSLVLDGAVNPDLSDNLANVDIDFSLDTKSVSELNGIENGVSVKKVDDGYDISVSKAAAKALDAAGNLTLKLPIKINKVTFKYTFGYKYNLVPDTDKIDAYYVDKTDTGESTVENRLLNLTYSAAGKSEDGTQDVPEDVKDRQVTLTFPVTESKKIDSKDIIEQLKKAKLVTDAVTKSAKQDFSANVADFAGFAEAAARKKFEGAQYDKTAASDYFYQFKSFDVKSLKYSDMNVADVRYDQVELADAAKAKASSTDAGKDEGSKPEEPDYKATLNKDGSVSYTVAKDAKQVKLTFAVSAVKYDYNYSYTYKKERNAAHTDAIYTAVSDLKGAVAAEDAKTAGFATPDLSVTPNGSATFKDYWSGVTGAIASSSEQTYDGKQMTFGDAESGVQENLLKAQTGLTASASFDKDYFKDATIAEKDGEPGTYQLSILPNNAFDNGERYIAVTWKYPNGETVKDADGQAVKTTVKVKSIERAPIPLSTLQPEDINFRLANNPEQLKEFKDKINAAVLKYTTDLYGDSYAKDDFVQDVDFINPNGYYDTADDPAGTTVQGSMYSAQFKASVRPDYQRKNDAAHGGSNFVLQPDEQGNFNPNIHLRQVEQLDWSKSQATNLTLTGKTGFNNKIQTKTINQPTSDAKNRPIWFGGEKAPEVAWAGGKLMTINVPNQGRLSLSNEAPFADKLDEFPNSSTSDGDQTNEFYVEDADGTIHHVSGVTYKYDKTAPLISAFEAEPVNDSGTRTYAKAGEVIAAKHMNVTFMTTEGDTNGTHAGLMDGASGMTLSYALAKSGSGYGQVGPLSEGNGVDRADTVQDGGYKYRFSINEDSKVKSDSIKVNLTDNAGNESKDLGGADALAKIKYAEMVAESSAPTIDISWDNNNVHNGKYYNANRTMTLTVHAPFFEYTQRYLGNESMAEVTRDGKAISTFTANSFHQVGTDTWQATMMFTDDGDYQVNGINVQDLVGRSATVTTPEFTIDKTNPTMQVTFDNNNASNGKYYNAARTATISITEHNFSPDLIKITPTANGGNGAEVGQPSISGWSASGDVHTATVTFPGQGVYGLSVEGQDLATNAMTPYTAPEFVVDTIKPKIDITNVANQTAYAGDIAPAASIDDTNLDANGSSISVTPIGFSTIENSGTNPFTNKAAASATKMSVNYANPLRLRENDGVYTMNVQAKDLAGNTESQAVTWSVNRFGSTYVISDATGKMLDQYLKSSKLVNVQVTEINPSGLDEKQTAIELTRDTKNTTLAADKNYQTKADSSKGWHEYTYTVDKANYEKKDGVYRVLFHSKDAAGNTSENTMEGKNAAKKDAAAEVNFAVDDSKPTVTFANLSPEAGKSAIEEAEHTGKITFDDNLKLAKAEIKVDGKTVATFDAKQLEASPVQEVTLKQSNKEQTVSAVVYDEAGNKSDDADSTIKVLVTTDALTLWSHNTPLMIGTFVVIAAVIGGVVLIVATKRKKDGEDQANA